MVEKIVKKCYSRYFEKEWKRLVRDPYHRIEFETTMHFLKKHLPKKKNALILDAGGGPGRYTIELAKKGFQVVLLDLSPENLKLAKKQIKKAKVQNKVKEVIEGNIVDLSRLESNSFDAVLCLGGPLSHVFGVKKRKKAVSELIRVAKKNAVVFVSVIGLISVVANAPRLYPDEINMSKHFKRFSEKGDDFKWHHKFYAHVFWPEEFEKLFKRKNFKILEKAGLEGVSSRNRIEVNRLCKKYPKAWKNWKNWHFKHCTHPAVFALSEHMLIVGRKT